MKKRIALLAAMAAAVSLAGCASQAGTQTTAAAETFEETSEEGRTEETAGAEGESGADQAEEAAILVFPIRIWGTITSVSEADGTITVDNQSDASSKGEIVFNISPEATLILDAENGFPVAFADIEKGSFEAYLGPVMTMSLPPQTTPELMIVNIPEDSRAPLYVTASSPLTETDNGRTLTAMDGTEYVLADDMQILPYLTKNIVMPGDIQEGSRCLLWFDDQDEVERIVLFAE